MLEVLALGALAVAGIIIFGVLFSLGSLFLWLITFPFRLLAFVFKGLGVLLALPFILLFGILGVAIFGVGVLIFLTPAVPFLLMVWLVWWLIHRPRRERVTSSNF